MCDDDSRRASIIVRFKFPSVLLVYYLSPPLLQDISYFITVLRGNHLLCVSSDLVESLENSTPFCQVTGDGYIYKVMHASCFTIIYAGTMYFIIPVIVSMFWLFHTITIFWKVWFPIHARKFEQRGNNKYLHIAVIVLALASSVLSVGVAFGTGGFVISAFPPSLNGCYGTRNLDASFYTLILPLCIINAMGVTTVFLTFYRMKAVLSKAGSL